MNFKGDSGGPLSIIRDDGSYQVGVVSFGPAAGYFLIIVLLFINLITLFNFKDVKLALPMVTHVCLHSVIGLLTTCKSCKKKIVKIMLNKIYCNLVTVKEKS